MRGRRSLTRIGTDRELAEERDADALHAAIRGGIPGADPADVCARDDQPVGLALLGVAEALATLEAAGLHARLGLEPPAELPGIMQVRREKPSARPAPSGTDADDRARSARPA